MSLEENKAITRRVVEEIWNLKRLELIEETFAQHLNNHGLVVLNGPEVIERIFSRWLTAFPDFHYTIEEVIAVGEKVIQRQTATGTHLGELRLPFTGIVPPTGKHFQVQQIHIYTLANGKIVEHRAIRDDLGMLQQLGIVPAPSQAEQARWRSELGAILPPQADS